MSALEDTIKWARAQNAMNECASDKDNPAARNMTQQAADELASLRRSHDELLEALERLEAIIPFDVLRMQAGNAFLDMEAVENARDRARAAIQKAK